VRILKFPLDGSDRVCMPTGSRVIHVADQRGKTTLWALCPDTDLVECRFKIYPTGGFVPDGYMHVGTVLEQNGDFVWHVFQVPPHTA
jgi:hypothetical protein